MSFRPFCDVLWFESHAPVLADAARFASAVHAVHPSALLAYNLSPSFNWALLPDDAVRSLQRELGKLGFCWQFITLAGHPTQRHTLSTRDTSRVAQLLTWSLPSPAFSLVGPP